MLPTPRTTLELILTALYNKLNDLPYELPTPHTNVEKILSQITLGNIGGGGGPVDPGPEDPEPTPDYIPGYSSYTLGASNFNSFSIGNRYQANVDIMIGGFIFYSASAGSTTVNLYDNSGNLLSSKPISADYPRQPLPFFFDSPIPISSGQRFLLTFSTSNVGFVPFNNATLNPSLTYVQSLYSTNPSLPPSLSDGVNKNSLVLLFENS